VGDRAAARRHVRAALGVANKSMTVGHPAMRAFVYGAMAEIDRARGELVAAVEGHERAVAALESAVGREARSLVDPLTFLGETLLAAKKHERAAEVLTRAVRLARPTEVAAGLRARALFGLARALGETKDTRGRATELAREALTQWGIAEGNHRSALASVERFLQRNK
jgi:hypothetical protein